ncbi:hypothetical protein CIPAW_16G040600 [Carya illinoinensis]|uniref:Uncharacterized protein n=1 Tax=Carya illinoinensis TaxID=32201 RepID=A0A8T1N3A5_CARIL|nr:hypothetical protein CIPAW_16G040600 [Carya illinoinensis]
MQFRKSQSQLPKASTCRVNNHETAKLDNISTKKFIIVTYNPAPTRAKFYSSKAIMRKLDDFKQATTKQAHKKNILNMLKFLPFSVNLTRNQYPAKKSNTEGERVIKKN